jgi:hypothetical protein
MMLKVCLKLKDKIIPRFVACCGQEVLPAASGVLENTTSDTAESIVFDPQIDCCLTAEDTGSGSSNK